jgi:hypothetical protein
VLQQTTTDTTKSTRNKVSYDDRVTKIVKMDALAAAADAAARASMEEEEMETEEEEIEMEEGQHFLTKSFFGSMGFARIYNEQTGALKLLQVKSSCAAQQCCTYSGIVLSNRNRCEACGYACHHSCTKELVPPLPSLVKNRICKGCVAVTCDAGQTSLKKADSSSVALARFLSLDLKSVPLELMSRKKYEEIHQQFEDGLLDAIEEDEEEDDEDYEEEEDDDDEGTY